MVRHIQAACGRAFVEKGSGEAEYLRVFVMLPKEGAEIEAISAFLMAKQRR
jgi:hypothetical protein